MCFTACYITWISIGGLSRQNISLTFFSKKHMYPCTQLPSSPGTMLTINRKPGRVPTIAKRAFPTIIARFARALHSTNCPVVGRGTWPKFLKRHISGFIQPPLPPCSVPPETVIRVLPISRLDKMALHKIISRFVELRQKR
jgi:hypothetical protein